MFNPHINDSRKKSRTDNGKGAADTSQKRGSKTNFVCPGSSKSRRSRKTVNSHVSSASLSEEDVATKSVNVMLKDEAVEWNDESTEGQGGTESLPVVVDDTCPQNSEKKEDNLVTATEENEWDRLLQERISTSRRLLGVVLREGGFIMWMMYALEMS